MMTPMPIHEEVPQPPSDRDYWFAELDTWGAAGRPYREIALWLTDERGLSAWWAQKLIVEYEQARGIRQPGVRRDGTFAVGASKTIGVSADRAFQAIVDAAARTCWLPGQTAEVRAAEAGRLVRLAFPDGTRLVVQLEARGVNRVSVAVEHQRLPDAATAAAEKAAWPERLEALKALLEGADREGR